MSLRFFGKYVVPAKLILEELIKGAPERRKRIAQKMEAESHGSDPRCAKAVYEKTAKEV